MFQTTLTVSAVILSLALASSASAMDVAQAYRLSLQQDPISLAADQALQAGREAALQGDSLLRPQISLQAGVTRLQNRQTGELAAPINQLMSTSSRGTAVQSAVQLVQPLYNGTLTANQRQLHQQTELARTQFAAARLQQAMHVAQVYFGVLLAEEGVRVTAGELNAVQLQRDRAQARFEVGQDRITDLQEAQARMDAVQTRLVASQATLELRRAQFSETVGGPATGLNAIAQPFVAHPPEPLALSEWQSVAELQSPHVQAGNVAYEVAKAELAKNSLSSRPTLALVARYSASNERGDLSPLLAPNGDRSGSVGVILNVPLYAGGGLDSRQREAVARLGQAEQQLAAARRDVRLQVQEAYLAVSTGVTRVSAQEQALRSARTALDATMQGRDVGTRTALDVLDAQQRYFAAQLDLMQGRVDYLLGRLRLAQAAGQLDESTLQGLSRWMQH